MGNKPDSVWTSSQLINSLTHQAQLFIFAYSPTTKTLMAWSDNASELLGVKDVEISRDGNLFLRHVHPDDRFALLSDLEAALENRSEYRATYRWIRPDNNEIRWLHCRAKSTFDNAEQLFEGVIVDLTPEFTGHVAQIAGPDSLASILAAFPTMVFTLDKDLRIIRLNRPPSMENFNFADMAFESENFKIGRDFQSCFGPGNQTQYLFDSFFEVLEQKKDYLKTRLDMQDAVYNLEALPLKEKNSVEGLLIVVSEITNSVKLERDIARLNKAEGLRLLANGVAHNFNNSLQTIVGYAATIRNNSHDSALIERSTQAIIDTVNRASELGRQLFTFDNGNSDFLSPVDINLSVMAAAQKVEDLFSSGLKISVAFGTPPPALANQDKLVEALIEVLKNAREHCKDESSLNIRTSQTNIHSNEVHGLRPGVYALISINDRGTGMSDYVQQRCLDPFYTTKNIDKLSGLNLQGLGLGLSNAYAIAREFGGTLLVDSKKSQGTSISIFIPIAEDKKASGKAYNNLFNVPDDLKPEILIIDDDLMVLQTVKQILEGANLKCIAAADARTAFSLLRQHKDHLRLALVDALMPGLNGASFLRRMKKINQEIKAIGFSGASGDAVKQLTDAGAISVLKKPVEPDVLKSTVISLLDAKAAA